MTEIMFTKLLQPRMSGELIERPRLLELFVRNRDLKLITVTAPAGYGKTVAALQYVNMLESPFVWYHLDSYDNDPTIFIHYLIAGFQKHFPGFGGMLPHRELQGNIAASLRHIVVSIVNELAGLSSGFVLVLDDYHQISAPVIHQFMMELLEHLPPGIQIVIIGRTPPAFPFARFQVNDELAIINRDALRFNASEVRDFLARRRVDISGSQIEALINKTDGWAAALKLLTGAAGKDLDAPVQEIKYIYNYLANEVFDRQPEETRDFMATAAVLETMTPEMCDVLMDRSDSEEILESLDRQQLFLIPLSGQEKAYRYHQLFGEFLLERLGSRRIRLQRKAAEIAIQQGNLDQAMEYYLAAGFDHDMLLLFQKAGKEALRQGKWQTVERWLGLLSLEQISANPWLCFFQAQIRIYQGKLDEAERWISQSLAGFSAVQDGVGIAECQFLQARILSGHGRHRESMVILEKAYPILQESTPYLRFDLPLEMALTLYRNERFQEAVQLLNQSLQTAEERHEFQIMAYLLEGLGHTYYWMGEHSKALQCYQKGIQISPNRMLPSYNFQDLTASIYQEWGELDAAMEYAQRSVAYKENLGMIEALPSAYYQLGSIYIDFGELRKAEECFRKGIDLAENGGERHFLTLNKAYLSRCYGFQGRFSESLAVAEEVLAEAETQTETLLASCRVICAPSFLQNGQIPKAKSLLLSALPSLERWNFAVPLSYAYATLAVLLFKTGDLKQAGEISRKLLELAARKNFIRLFLTISDLFLPILRYGLLQGIEVSYIQRIFVRIRENGLTLLNEAARHPDPEVRGRTILPLIQINNAVSQELLQHLNNDPDPGVRCLLKQYAGLSGQTGLNSSLAFGDTTSKDRCQSPDQNPEPIPLLQIHSLGPARIMIHHNEITHWRFMKSRDLLLYLCHRGQPVGISQIVEDLWPDIPFEKGVVSFHSVLYWLRQAIQKATPVKLVTYKSKTCELLPTVYTTDRDRFISLMNAGSGDLVTPKNLSALEEGIALYRGEYLSQLDYPWAIPEREHLKRLHLETVIRLAKFYLQNRDYLKTVGVLEPLAEQNPLREEIFGLLMSAYAALGDRLAVIRRYQKLKSNLAEELGLEPPPEITKLYYDLCGSETGARKGLKKA